MPSPAYYNEYDKKGAKENADHPMELNMRISHPNEKLSLEDDALPLESDSFLLKDGGRRIICVRRLSFMK